MGRSSAGDHLGDIDHLARGSWTLELPTLGIVVPCKGRLYVRAIFVYLILDEVEILVDLFSIGERGFGDFRLSPHQRLRISCHVVVISVIEIFFIGFDALVHLVDFNHISGRDEVGLLHNKGILPHLTV